MLRAELLLMIVFIGMSNSVFEEYEIAYRLKRNKSSAQLKNVPFKNDTKAFTICYRVFHKEKRATHFSYAIPSDPSHIVIERFENATELWVSNTNLRIDTRAPPQEYEWVHYCYTWSASDGKVQTFKGGQRDKEAIFEESKSLSVMGGGIIVFGQRQHSYGGDFDLKTSLPCVFTDIEIWDRVLSDCEVYHASINNIAGNIVSWNCVKDKWQLTRCIFLKPSFIPKFMKSMPIEPKNVKTCVSDNTPAPNVSCIIGNGSLSAGNVSSGSVSQPPGNVPAGVNVRIFFGRLPY